MVIEIKGFLKSEYNNFLITPPMSFRSKLKAVINRIAQFILSGFEEWRKNAFLFEKFAARDFLKIDNEKEYVDIRHVFAKINECPEFNFQISNKINHDLNLVREKWKKKDPQNDLGDQQNKIRVIIPNDQKAVPASNPFILSSPDIDLKDSYRNLLVSSCGPSSQSVPIPESIKKIIAENLLFESLDSAEAKLKYKQNLLLLSQFENSLPVGVEFEDPAYKPFLIKMDDAFKVQLNQAQVQCEDFHKNKFSSIVMPWEIKPQLQANGEVLCTADQLERASNYIAKTYPELYELGLNAPSVGVNQRVEVAKLIKTIFFGPLENQDAASASDFIRLRSTLNKSTPSFAVDKPDGHFFKVGSFIASQCMAQVVDQGQEDVSESMGKLSAGYFNVWSPMSKVSLQLGETKFLPSQGSEWVQHIQKDYAAYLLETDKEEICRLVAEMKNCPLLQLIKKTYPTSEFDTSYFPSELMRLLLRLGSSSNQIHHLIKKTHLDQTIVDQLVEKSGCELSEIEPLLRLRVFYIICCLSPKMYEQALLGLDQRADSMYDPRLLGNNLVCQPSGMHLKFDRKLDAIEGKIDVDFKNSKLIDTVACGQTTFSVSSIANTKGPSQVVLKDLTDLRFNIFASTTQQNYLTAQVAPETLLQNMNALCEALKKLKPVWKDAQYHSVLEKCLPCAMQEAKNLVTYLNTINILDYRDQLTQKQLDDFREALDKILSHFYFLIGSLENQSELKNNPSIFDAMNYIRELIQIRKDAIGVAGTTFTQIKPSKIYRSHEYMIAGLKKLKSVEEIPVAEPLNLEVGWVATAINYAKFAIKLSSNHFKQATAYLKKTITKESSDLNMMGWKITRFESVLGELKRGVEEYFNSIGLDIDTLIEEGENPFSLRTWKQQILPLLNFCRHNFANEDKEDNADYVVKLRGKFIGYVQSLREAARWANSNVNREGIKHIDALCYQFYTGADLNPLCETVVQEFVKLGSEKCKPKNDHAELNDPKYALISELPKIHRCIKAAPRAAKDPVIKSWLKSLIGHMNGATAYFPFSPNEQSNNVHRLLRKKMTYFDGKKIKEHFTEIIAMGSPTYEDGSGEVEICPIFQRYIAQCERIGERHVYYNMQNLILEKMKPETKSWFSWFDYNSKLMDSFEYFMQRLNGDEASRCRALHDFAELHPKAFMVVTLSNNSAFYYQKEHEFVRKSFELTKGVIKTQELNISTVKEELISQLLSGNYLPKDVSNSDAKSRLNMAMHEMVLKHYKNFPPEFSDVKEREVFVQRFYGYLRIQFARHEFKEYTVYDRNVENFKDELIRQKFDLLPEVSGNLIPKQLVAQHGLKGWCQRLANQMHEIVFKGVAELQAAKKRIFIDLFDGDIRRKVDEVVKPHNSNGSCKDRIDRGAAVQAIEFARNAILKGCMEHPEVVEFFKWYVHARAILVRKRGIIDERFERMMDTIQFMLDHQDELRELDKVMFPNSDVVIDYFETLDIQLFKKELNAILPDEN